MSSTPEEHRLGRSSSCSPVPARRLLIRAQRADVLLRGHITCDHSPLCPSSLAQPRSHQSCELRHQALTDMRPTMQRRQDTFSAWALRKGTLKVQWWLTPTKSNVDSRVMPDASPTGACAGPDITVAPPSSRSPGLSAELPRAPLPRPAPSAPLPLAMWPWWPPGPMNCPRSCPEPPAGCAGAQPAALPPGAPGQLGPALPACACAMPHPPGALSARGCACGACHAGGCGAGAAAKAPCCGRPAGPAPHAHVNHAAGRAAPALPHKAVLDTRC